MSKIILIENRSELGENKAKEIEKIYKPMVERLYELEDKFNEIVNEPITQVVSDKAKLLRLQISKSRTSADKARKSAKAEYLRAGNAIQGAYNTLLYAVASKEEKLKEIETHFERIEAERIEAIRTERAESISEYLEYEPADLGTMPKDVWINFLAGTKATYEAKIAAELKAENERIEKEQAEKEEQERIRLENEKLKAEALELEKKAEAERKEAAEKLRKEQAKAEKKRKEAAEKERIEREKLAAIEAKKRAEINDKLKAEREEKEKVEAELKAKQRAENEAKLRAAKEAKSKAAAPDKVKLSSLATELYDFELPKLSTSEGKSIIKSIRTLLDKTANYADEQVAKL